MYKQIMKGLALVFIIVFIVGCTSGGGIRTRTYIEDKQRVDQEMEGGNQGYIGGTPIPANRDDIRKTRKVYVLEITKELPEEDQEIVVTSTPAAPVNLPPQSKPTTPDWAKPIVIPNLDEIETGREAQTPGETKLVDYQVQKDDTLQKISKKFYDSYSKWTRIYEANKDVIKNPDRITPGITIKIPVEE